MDSTDEKTIHVAAIPYPGRGHISPMLNLTRLISDRLRRHVVITVVVTEEWKSSLLSASSSSGLYDVRLETIPNILPLERHRGSDPFGFVEAVLTRMCSPVEQLLQKLNPPVDFIIADAFLSWIEQISKKIKVPASAVFTQSATMLLAVVNSARQTPLSTEGPDEVSRSVDYLPATAADLSTHSKTIENFKKDIAWSMTMASSILFTTFYELESNAIDTLRLKLSVPIYPLAISIPYNLRSFSFGNNDGNYYKWLNCRPRNSVLYISLVSFLSVTSSQMEELAAGLRFSGVHFMWVLRGDDRIKEIAGGNGLVLPWCDQLGLLFHDAVGGFLTHCGWNAVNESVLAGVPMITLPIFWDQFPNSKVVVDDWKIGLRLNKADGLVNKEEFAKVVTELMDLNGNQSKEIRKRATELKEKCRRSVEVGGSTARKLDDFIHDLLRRKTDDRIDHV